MRDGVKFLLDRMDTNPEEFYQQRNRDGKHEWLSTINAYKKFFNEEEKELVQTKLSEINLEQMKSYVVEKLLASNENDEEVERTPDPISKILEAGLNDAFKEAYEKQFVNQFGEEIPCENQS